YCGITTHPERRLEQHNGLRPGGARYTRSRRPVKFRACRPCADRSQAGRLERYIQSLPRCRKLAFFLEMNPAFPLFPCI
ncbi:MAG: GIY-YIG nuclease family protein, partial [Desulfovibrionaceae bacterium]|nr:GIY-YIG nuclease family protein [Desulfovibrionaceae bacterium]